MFALLPGTHLSAEARPDQHTPDHHTPCSVQGPNDMAQRSPVMRHSQFPSAQAGRQLQTGLWTNLDDICRILQIKVPSGAAATGAIFQHMRFRKGQRIYTIGQPFSTLYIVHSGFLKTVHLDAYGNEQVLYFPMKGDVLGVDGICDRRYATEAVALSDCDVILLPFAQLISLGRTFHELPLLIYTLVSRELLREQSMVSMLGSLSAEAKVARFLASLSDRFSEMGYARNTFNLRMTRQEIGSYLGVTLETVSRTLAALSNYKFITVNRSSIGICDLAVLRTLVRLPNLKAKIKQNGVECIAVHHTGHAIGNLASA